MNLVGGWALFSADFAEKAGHFYRAGNAIEESDLHAAGKPVIFDPMRSLRGVGIFVAIVFGILVGAGVALWRYHHSPGYAVKELRAAYDKQDAARAERFLSAQGRTLFALALDPDNYTPLAATKTEPQEATATTAVFHFHGLTRFGPLEADLRLIRADGRWQLDDVFLISIGGAEIGQTASALASSPQSP